MEQRPPYRAALANWDGPVKQAGTSRRGARRVLGAVSGAAAVLALGSCGENKFSYVDNSAENTYIRVPNEWKVFTVEGGGVRPEAFPDSVESVWHIAFDASQKPSLDNTAAIDALPPSSVDEPVGQLQIFDVTGSFNQELSLTTARSTALGIDPLGVPDEIKDLVEIVSYTPLSQDGMQGSRVVYNLHNEGEPWQTVDATTLFDQSRNRFYVLRIGCTSECFRDNQDDISEIATSWKVVR
jgi:hypothetical protein